MWFIMGMSGGVKITTSDMIRELCEKMNISISELARRVGQSPQKFNVGYCDDFFADIFDSSAYDEIVRQYRDTK